MLGGMSKSGSSCRKKTCIVACPSSGFQLCNKGFFWNTRFPDPTLCIHSLFWYTTILGLLNLCHSHQYNLFLYYTVARISMCLWLFFRSKSCLFKSRVPFLYLTVSSLPDWWLNQHVLLTLIHKWLRQSVVTNCKICTCCTGAMVKLTKHAQSKTIWEFALE